MDFIGKHRSDKHVFFKRGSKYTRKGYDLKVDTAYRFKIKCQKVGLCETQCVEMLVENFVKASGWDDTMKQPPFFETNGQEHIKQAVRWAVKDLFSVK